MRQLQDGIAILILQLDVTRAHWLAYVPDYIDEIISLTNELVAAVAEWYRYRTVACFVTGSSPVPLKTRRVGQRCTFNLSRAETSSRCDAIPTLLGVDRGNLLIKISRASGPLHRESSGAPRLNPMTRKRQPRVWNPHQSSTMATKMSGENISVY
ncbi:hypothetical protein TNCV_1446911 [Trichonephila clavipes]|nr:hypothetical protein TNCV_1446911 [Trichonephila clavipes]